MTQSDDVCTIQLGKIVGKKLFWDTSLSIATDLFTGGAAIVTGNIAHSVLAGIGGLANGSREAIDADVYSNQVIQAVTQAIENERSSLRAKIVSYYTKPLNEWSIDDAIRDVDEYHQQCSFYRGLELVVSSVSKTAGTQSGSNGKPAETQPGDGSDSSLMLQVQYWRTRALFYEEKNPTMRKALLANEGKLEQAMLALAVKPDPVKPPAKKPVKPVPPQPTVPKPARAQSVDDINSPVDALPETHAAPLDTSTPVGTFQAPASNDTSSTDKKGK